MKTSRLRFLAAAGVFLALATFPASVATAQPGTDVATGNAKTIMLEPIEITHKPGRTLSFGLIFNGGTQPDPVRIYLTPNTNSAPTRDYVDPADAAHVRLLGAAGLGPNDFQDDGFDVRGQKRQPIQVDMDPSIVITNAAGQNMAIDAIVFEVFEDGSSTQILSPPGRGGRFVMPDSGFVHLEVGGQLIIDANAQPGLYQGTYVVAVKYV